MRQSDSTNFFPDKIILPLWLNSPLNMLYYNIFLIFAHCKHYNNNEQEKLLVSHFRPLL